MNKYPAYKDSGIEWIGEIPEHWEVRRMRYLCDIGTGDKDTENKEENGEYPFYVRSQTVERISTYSFDGEAILTAGDGDICKIWHYIDGKFAYHQRVYRMSHFNDILGKYLFYYLKENFIKEVKKLSAKSTVDSLRRPMFQNFKVVFGTKDEQAKIINYLDTKTAQINTLISNKQKLIELLKEERVAIINQIVTKGLDPNVPMRHSGIEWLGEIPAHWKVKPLRYVGQCQNGISKGAESFGSGFPFVSYGDVYKNLTLPLYVTGLVESTEADREIFSVKEGDVFFTRTSETIEEIGLASTCMSTIENATFAGFLIRFRPEGNILTKEFSKYYFRSQVHRVYFVKEMNLVTRASLSQGLLKKLPVLLPSPEEQREIATFLDSKINGINAIITKTQQEIDLLKEYKTALISEVVTGKIDVREEILEETCSSF